MSHGLFSANKLQFSLLIVSGAHEGLCLIAFEVLKEVLGSAGGGRKLQRNEFFRNSSFFTLPEKFI